jgi:hypothetical protein
MAETVTLELVCSRCGQWLMRWTADPERPFGEQITGDGQGVSPTVVRSEAPGEYLRASDGQWRRWAPGRRRAVARRRDLDAVRARLP